MRGGVRAAGRHCHLPLQTYRGVGMVWVAAAGRYRASALRARRRWRGRCAAGCLRWGFERVSVRIGRRRVEQRLIWRVLRVGGGRAWRRGSVEAAEPGGGAAWEVMGGRTAGERVPNGLSIVAGYRE